MSAGHNKVRRAAAVLAVAVAVAVAGCSGGGGEPEAAPETAPTVAPTPEPTPVVEPTPAPPTPTPTVEPTPTPEPVVDPDVEEAALESILPTLADLPPGTVDGSDRVPADICPGVPWPTRGQVAQVSTTTTLANNSNRVWSVTSFRSPRAAQRWIDEVHDRFTVDCAEFSTNGIFYDVVEASAPPNDSADGGFATQWRAYFADPDAGGRQGAVWGNARYRHGRFVIVAMAGQVNDGSFDVSPVRIPVSVWQEMVDGLAADIEELAASMPGGRDATVIVEAAE